MPKAINKKCANCAKLPIDESRKQPCWVESKCKHKRNHYNSRDRKLVSKKLQYAKANDKIIPTEFEIVPDSYRSELILYGKQPNKLAVVKGGVKGFQVLIYKGSTLISQSNLVMTAGMVQSDLEEAIDKGLEQVDRLYDIKKWGRILWKNTL